MTACETDEQRLVERCIEELPYVVNAYQELVARYEKPVFGLCMRYLAARDLAEDASQEVFLKVFHSIAKFEQRSSFKTWLFSIAINHCRSVLAKQNKLKQRYETDHDLDEVVDERMGSAEQCAAEADDKVCVHEVIGHLKGSDRDMILMRFSNAMGLEEISDIVGKSLSPTTPGCYRALDKFKALYERLCT